MKDDPHHLPLSPLLGLIMLFATIDAILSPNLVIWIRSRAFDFKKMTRSLRGVIKGDHQ